MRRHGKAATLHFAVNCAVCKRPLFDGATACIVCGAPVSPPGAGQGPMGAPQQQQMPITDAYAPTYRSAEAPRAQPYEAPPPNPFAPQQQANPFAPQQAQQQQQQQANPFAPPQPPANPFAPQQAQQQQQQVNPFAPQQAQPMANGYGPGIPPPPPITAYPAQYYAPPLSRSDPQNVMATVGFICGLFGLVPFWIGFMLCIAAIVCSGFGLQHSARLPGQRGRGLAIAGLVLGIVFILPAGCGL